MCIRHRSALWKSLSVRSTKRYLGRRIRMCDGDGDGDDDDEFFFPCLILAMHDVMLMNV